MDSAVLSLPKGPEHSELSFRSDPKWNLPERLEEVGNRAQSKTRGRDCWPAPIAWPLLWKSY